MENDMLHHSDINDLAKKNGCRFMKSGIGWFCLGDSFISFSESECWGHGKTKEEALMEYTVNQNSAMTSTPIGKKIYDHLHEPRG